MRNRLSGITVALSFVWLFAGAQTANAAPLGPICFSTLPFADVLVWFLNSSGSTPNATYFAANGRDLGGDRAQTVSVHVDGNNLVFGYTTLPSAPGAVPVFAGGKVSLATLQGPGQCFAPDLAGCGAFTMKVIACPSTASAPAVSEGATRGLQGQP